MFRKLTFIDTKLNYVQYMLLKNRVFSILENISSKVVKTYFKLSFKGIINSTVTDSLRDDKILLQQYSYF